jgi:hypothetical protein
MPLVQLSLTYVVLGADHGAVGAFHSVDEAVARPAGGAFQKAGIKELVIEPWFGVFVPAGTPAFGLALMLRETYPKQQGL